MMADIIGFTLCIGGLLACIMLMAFAMSAGEPEPRRKPAPPIDLQATLRAANPMLAAEVERTAHYDREARLIYPEGDR